MHHIYRTKTFVLSSIPRGESGKYITFLSEDFGVIKVEAQAVRKSDSKLRHAIQDYSMSDISFVRGKTGNKLVNAHFDLNLFYDFDNAEILRSIKKIFTLIERMCVDELEDRTVFTVMTDLLHFLKNDFTKATLVIEKEKLQILESIVVYRILVALGYIENSSSRAFIINEPISEELILNFSNKDKTFQKEIIRLINQAIHESQL